MAHLPSLAELAELSVRLGVTLDDPESPDALRAQAALDDASALIRAEAGMDWPEDEVPDLIVAITIAVAYRAYRNPDGTVQASVGDVSVSYGQGGGGGSVYLTREEARAIRRVAGRSSVGSVEVTSDMLAARDPWYVPVSDGGDMLPIGPVPWEE